jgi:hypothetical protein
MYPLIQTVSLDQIKTSGKEYSPLADRMYDATHEQIAEAVVQTLAIYGTLGVQERVASLARAAGHQIHFGTRFSDPSEVIRIISSAFTDHCRTKYGSNVNLFITDTLDHLTLWQWTQLVINALTDAAYCDWWYTYEKDYN